MSVEVGLRPRHTVQSSCDVLTLPLSSSKIAIFYLSYLRSEIVEHNPLASKLEAATAAGTKLREKRAELQRELHWRVNFDRAVSVASSDLQQATRDTLAKDLEFVSTELSLAQARTATLEDKAKLGWAPSYWFSGNRSAAKAALIQHQKLLAELESRKRMISTHLATAQAQLDELRQAITKFDSYDYQAALDALTSIDAELLLREAELADLSDRKTELDRQLTAPLEELKNLRSALDDLERELKKIQGTLREAERLDAKISRAANSYDRAMLHQECERRLGDSSPRTVIRDAQGQIRKKNRHIEAVQRNIKKVEVRIEHIGDRGSRTIRAIIIDGNNLCYEGRQFIGLAALPPLCRHLASSYEVTVVFDASIRRALGVNDRDLDHALANVKVHVVSTRGKADETILHAAQDPFVFVLSNDRYAEYREQPAVRDNRLIRHEIINGRVLVHDLALDVPFVT